MQFGSAEKLMPCADLTIEDGKWKNFDLKDSSAFRVVIIDAGTNGTVQFEPYTTPDAPSGATAGFYVQGANPIIGLTYHG